MNHWTLARWGKLLLYAGLMMMGTSWVLSTARQTARERAEATVAWHEMEHHEDDEEGDDDA